MNQPGYYLHWSIITISLANLIVIVVMLLLFGLALLLPFPKSKSEVEESSDSSRNDEAKPTATTSKNLISDNAMWTARLRILFQKFLPPDKLIPDRQPAYVDSWVYVFGVATLASLFIVVVSGIVIAIGGTDWWHTNPLGHFFNSLHLWGVEIFMASMVIHLWGKFWMAAWRGKRALTWVTGMIAFSVSIMQCFTGYLSQQNFDSQWIATNGKDAINSTGFGNIFNLMNFGQMLLWHVVLVPIALLSFIALHVLLVRVRGVSHPISLKKTRSKQERSEFAKLDATEWAGTTKRYDILKEGTIAIITVFILIVLLASLLSSPDLPPLTIATWANQAPADFMTTVANELARTSETATYGPPYNNGSSNVQTIGISWQKVAGVHEPIDTAQSFVLSPLSKIASTNSSLAEALTMYQNASTNQQQNWNQAYQNTVAKVIFNSGVPVLPKADYGPVPVLINTELILAQSGALDADLLAEQPFFGTNYTKPLMFLEDGTYFATQAKNQHLTGSQWGVMNGTGRYPGQPWLWLYTLWYQLPWFSSSPNVDLIAIYLTTIATILLLAVPFIPVLRDIPYVIPLHRLIWRRWNKIRSKSTTKMF